MEDQELLNQFVAGGSPDALAELVRRNGGLVFAAARRQTGDHHLAEDVTQAVFLLLSRKARQLQGRPVAGWLLKATRFVCRDAKRMLARRKYYERRAALMRTEAAAATEPDWEVYAGEFDGAMAGLSSADRDALTLRYLRGMKLREVGTAMGISEEAARKRVDRSLLRLRKTLAAKEAAPAVELLALQLAAHGTQAAPAALLQSIIGALSGGIGKGTFIWAIAQKTRQTMAWIKIKIAASVLAAVSVLGAGMTAVIVLAGGNDAPPTAVVDNSPPQATVPNAVQPAPASDAPLAQITLQVRDADARDVLRQIGDQAHVPTDVWPQWLWSGQNGSPTKLVSLKLDHENFWPAIDRFGRATNSIPNFMGGPHEHALSMMEASGPSQSGGLSGVVCQSGAFTIVAVSLNDQRATFLATGHQERQASLQMNAYADPALRILKYSFSPHIDIAVDENGVSMLPAAPQGAANMMNSQGDWLIQGLSAPLTFAPHAGKLLADVKGSLRVLAATAFQTVQIDDATHAAGRSVSVPGRTLTLDAFTLNGNSGDIRLSANRDAGGQAGEPDITLSDEMQGSLTLVDADGNVLSLNGGGISSQDSWQSEMSFGSSNFGKTPVRLVWRAAIAVRQEDVPFEFNNLPIPPQ